MIRGAGGDRLSNGTLEPLSRCVGVDKVFELIKVHIEREFDLLFDGLTLCTKNEIACRVCIITRLGPVGGFSKMMPYAFDALSRILFGMMVRL